MRTTVRVHLAVAVASLVVGACASSGTATPTTPATGSTQAAATTVGPGTTAAAATTSTALDLKIRDSVTFSTSTPGAQWTPPQLDVYAPPAASGLPLVVLFPAHSITKDDFPLYRQLARALAERGVVVVVANWSDVRNGADTADTADEAVEMFGAAMSVARCAVDWAVTHAGALGADPDRLVLAGQFYGANVAAELGDGQRPTPVSGCVTGAAPAAVWTVRAVVGIDGDWLGGYDVWDRFGSEAWKIVASLSPWYLGDARHAVPTLLVLTTSLQADTVRCGGEGASWIVQRDPQGLMRRQLAALGLLADGCVDGADAVAVDAQQLIDLGAPATVLRLDDAASSAQLLTEADLARLARAVADLASS